MSLVITPSIPLTIEQNEFLQEVNARTQGTLFNGWHRQLAKGIALNGGCREIYRSEAGKPVLYLKRHYIYRGPDREAMIHQFFLGDKGPLHDHPAASWGSILETGYYERLCTSIVNGRTEGEYNANRVAGDWSFRPASTPEHDNFEGFHKVKLRDPIKDAGNVFTFFVMEKRNENAWGFRDNMGNFIPFDQMNKNEKTEKVQSSPDDFGYGWFPTRKAGLVTV